MVKMIKCTHFLYHLALMWLVADMVEVQAFTKLFACYNMGCQQMKSDSNQFNKG